MLAPPEKETAQRGLGGGRFGIIRSQSNNTALANAQARLHPHWCGGRDGYRYSVIFRGECIVSRSRDPETDAARSLLAKGITGRITLLDGKKGKPRTVIDIELAAKLCTVERSRDGLRFDKIEQTPRSAPSSPETGVVEAVVAERKRGAR